MGSLVRARGTRDGHFRFSSSVQHIFRGQKADKPSMDELCTLFRSDFCLKACPYRNFWITTTVCPYLKDSLIVY